jgi:hypothetical protein
MALTKAELLSLQERGFVEITFSETESLKRLQALAKDAFQSDPEHWHERNSPQELHLAAVKHLTDEIVHSDLVTSLIRSNQDIFTGLLGPDVDVQAAPHVRVSRPHLENDLIHWHRDTFYGANPWELNIWFPLFTLKEGAGLLFVEGSHRLPSNNVREIKDHNEFRRSVKKGSVAHQVGYVYLPKIDDAIAEMDSSNVRLLSPAFGQAIFFFGCGIHTAQNLSDKTRVTIDVRVKNAHATSNTRPGYYKPLARGLISQCSERFFENSEPTL